MISVKITYEGKTHTISLKTKRNVEEVIKEFGLNPQTVLMKLNGEFVADDEKVKDGDRLDLIRITSIG